MYAFIYISKKKKNRKFNVVSYRNLLFYGIIPDFLVFHRISRKHIDNIIIR